ncbi:cytochrome-c oxidase, cbb3-type subunit III [Hwanghaeella grinnelliae]|uniref:Cbb3-type cytochrome c oxidase subunit n=1 Tax=Hwanghaeella grinnelliae TaxID=2500179 RepID=A0A437QUH2_9PROT|nr:cytochrome-c oxidase, cbb3-type subunit III [Hwanghaeella grinnelliae]RVU38148.1 cytochrome-c oxidase, cbb3-type subunit III [Hwanghaeella grinnelliae]
MTAPHKDELSGVDTTGHEWDGIRELDNPLPRWWLWVFYACIAYAIGYCIYYPAIPLINSATQGISGYSSRAELHQEVAAAEEGRAGLIAQIDATNVEDIAKNDSLHRFAVSGGASAFKVYCSQCHGSGAQGSPGYPNLNDDVWLWGGTVEEIHQTITHGIRYNGDEDTRFSEMPAFGRDQILSGSDVRAAANFVGKLANLEHDAALAEAGATVYADNCVSCHGEAGKGMRDLGAPNLTDAVWLYGDTVAEIAAQISAPQHGVMPAWGERLGDVTVKQLAVFVHSLGGGE